MSDARHLLAVCFGLLLPILPAQDTAVLTGIVREVRPRFAAREVLWRDGEVPAAMALELAGQPRLEDALVTGEGPGVAEVLLRLAGLGSGTESKLEDPHWEIAKARFAPGLQLAPASGRLQVRNRDPIAYEFDLLDERGSIVDRLVVPPQEVAEATAPMGRRFGLRARGHEFMEVWGHRSGPDLLLRTGSDGRFRIAGLSPGPLDVELFHPALGTLNRRIELLPGQNEQAFDTTAFSDLALAVAIGDAPFGGGGETVLEIDGLPITRGPVRRLRETFRRRYDGLSLPDRILDRFAVREVFLPVATTFAHEWRARQELRVRAELLRQNLSQGELVLQARFERNPELFAGARKEVFRDVDWARLDVYTASFEPELRAGTIVGPFYDTQGLVLMQFQTRDAEPAGPVRDLLRLTFAYRPDVDPAVQARRSLALARRARVRVVDEAWRPLVDPASTR